MPSKHTVVIVGAGLAGAKAATGGTAPAAVVGVDLDQEPAYPDTA